MLQNSDRTADFIRSLGRDNTQFLIELEKKAHADDVPIIRNEVQDLLKFLLELKAPSKVLEIGTAVGFSAILMCTYGPEAMKIVTIEDYEKRIPEAVNNIRMAGFENRISLIQGDANDVLKDMDESFDMVFIDAAKAQYINYLPDVLRMTVPGGLIVSDNCLQDGDIIESKYAVTRRNRTIHKRMREYLYAIKNNDALVTTILPVGDGVALSVKRDHEKA